MTDTRSARTALDVAPALIGLGVVGLLLAVSERYGYFRDEFYFVASGRRLALGYVDNPPLTPWLARLQVELFGDSPTALRILPAIAIGLTVVLAGRMASELGGDRVAATVAAAATAGSAFLLATGHVLSTSTFDVLFWAALCWLLLRALRDGGPVWLAVGAVAGIGLLNKTLVLGLLGAMTVAVLAVGPRRALADRWLWLGAALAVALWTPHLVWQAVNGWPQLSFGWHIATVGSGGSEPRWTFPLFQLVGVSPVLAPIWIAGLWVLVRDPALRWARAFAVAYGVLFVLLLVAGGKHYYLAGMYPVLLAAGALPVVRWARRARARRVALGAVLVVNVPLTASLMLPLIPVQDLPDSPQAAVSPIPVETVGWPELVTTVAEVHRSLPEAQRERTVVLASNYGSAGAVELFRTRPATADLPPAYSGHNSYADWGPPTEEVTTVVAVGYDEATLRRWFTDVRALARVDNAVGVANDERGALVSVATGRKDTWERLWPQLRRLA